MAFYQVDDANVTPSGSAGVSWEVELNNRMVCCEVMQTAGKMLALPQRCINTAQIMLHRFFYRESMTEVSCFVVSMACLFAATKVEEAPCALNSVLVVFDRVLKRMHGRPTDKIIQRGSTMYRAWKAQVVDQELAVLTALGFVVTVDHPHHYALRLIEALQPHMTTVSDELWSTLAQKTWNTLSDCQRTTVCLRFPPNVVAAAALSWNCHVLQVALPGSALGAMDAKQVEVDAISQTLTKMYSQRRLRYLSVKQGDKSEFLVMPSSEAKNVSQQRRTSATQPPSKSSSSSSTAKQGSLFSSASSSQLLQQPAPQSSSRASVLDKAVIIEQMRAKARAVKQNATRAKEQSSRKRKDFR